MWDEKPQSYWVSIVQQLWDMNKIKRRKMEVGKGARERSLVNHQLYTSKCANNPLALMHGFINQKSKGRVGSCSLQSLSETGSFTSAHRITSKWFWSLYIHTVSTQSHHLILWRPLWSWTFVCKTHTLWVKPGMPLSLFRRRAACVKEIETHSVYFLELLQERQQWIARENVLLFKIVSLWMILCTMNVWIWRAMKHTADGSLKQREVQVSFVGCIWRSLQNGIAFVTLLN